MSHQKAKDMIQRSTASFEPCRCRARARAIHRNARRWESGTVLPPSTKYSRGTVIRRADLSIATVFSCIHAAS